MTYEEFGYETEQEQPSTPRGNGAAASLRDTTTPRSNLAIAGRAKMFGCARYVNSPKSSYGKRSARYEVS